MNKNIEILEVLNKDSKISQRELSKRVNISVGKVKFNYQKSLLLMFLFCMGIHTHTQVKP